MHTYMETTARIGYVGKSQSCMEQYQQMHTYMDTTERIRYVGKYQSCMDNRPTAAHMETHGPDDGVTNDRTSRA